MPLENPLEKPKHDYQQTIERIKSESAVGIDAQYTHAIIIEYLKQISQKLDILEKKLGK